MKSAICRIELPGGEQIERGTTESGFGHQFYGYASPISSKNAMEFPFSSTPKPNSLWDRLSASEKKFQPGL